MSKDMSECFDGGVIQRSYSIFFWNVYDPAMNTVSSYSDIDKPLQNTRCLRTWEKYAQWTK